MDDIKMSDGQQRKQIEENGDKYLGFIWDIEIKTKKMNGKIKTEYLRRVIKLVKLETGNV